jgi:hypothetical protein
MNAASSNGMSAVSPDQNRLARWRPCRRSPGELRLHPALIKVDLLDVAVELNRIHCGSAIPGPVLITTDGILIGGIAIWHKARIDGAGSIECMECSLCEDEALQFILDHYRLRKGWVAFIRIRLALTREPGLQEKALANRRAGASTRLRQICRKLSEWTFVNGSL